LGRNLDQQHAEFLRAADGWDAFYQEVDMFGTQDFCGSERMVRARELIATLEPLEPHCGVPSSELLPIATSSADVDIFLLHPAAAGSGGGKVFWWAGQLIEVFPSFSEFFLSMADLNRNEIKQLTEEANRELAP
jgi:hypothetical protein